MRSGITGEKIGRLNTSKGIFSKDIIVEVKMSADQGSDGDTGFVFHSCETESGSSGSFIVDENNTALAMHCGQFDTRTKSAACLTSVVMLITNVLSTRQRVLAIDPRLEGKSHFFTFCGYDVFFAQ